MNAPEDSGSNTREQEGVLGYFVPAMARDMRDDFALSQLVRRCWRGRWIILVGTIFFAALFIAWATFSQKVYRASAVLSIVRPDGTGENGLGIGGQLGALAAAAGLRAGSTAQANREEFLAFLKSRRLQAAFIESENLLPVLYADRWDATKKAWKTRDAEAAPVMDDAVELLRRHYLRIEVDKLSGLVSVSFESTNRKLVAKWTEAYVALANRAVRNRTTVDSERSLEFLNRELDRAAPVAVQQAIYGLIQSQLNTKMLASVREEYAFRTVDTATEPSVRRHVRPVRRAYAVIGAFLGLLVSSIFVVLRYRERDV